jgi:disulfide oxidoreductase YuzD
MQNVTIDDSKFVTTAMLENWKKNMTDWITDALDRKFSACDYAVTVLKVAIRTKSRSLIYPSMKTPPLLPVSSLVNLSS